MDEATAVRELLTWFLDTEDEPSLRSGVQEIDPSLWPGFSAEASDELLRNAHTD